MSLMIHCHQDTHNRFLPSLLLSCLPTLASRSVHVLTISDCELAFSDTDSYALCCPSGLQAFFARHTPVWISRAAKPVFECR